MPKEAVFTMKLESDLRAEFVAEAEAARRPASQVLRELMRDFIQRQREAREYDAFLGHKVEIARLEMRAGRMLVPTRPGVGLTPSEQARRWTREPAEFGQRP